MSSTLQTDPFILTGNDLFIAGTDMTAVTALLSSVLCRDTDEWYPFSRSFLRYCRLKLIPSRIGYRHCKFVVLEKALYVKMFYCDEVVVFDCIVRGTSYKVVSLSGIMSVLSFPILPIADSQFLFLSVNHPVQYHGLSRLICLAGPALRMNMAPQAIC